MSTRKEIVGNFYDQTDENSRLLRTRHGQLEYFTTMTYNPFQYIPAFRHVPANITESGDIIIIVGGYYARMRCKNISCL